MIEWNLFYKMLGIPEDVTEPTYYDLLGVHPKACSAELVESMLHRRKSMLRQNIPGPQFIPLVLKFEQKKLERAAAVLRDPEMRQKYNRYLRRKAGERKCEKQKERARRNLLENARSIVNSFLNPDKTLDDSNRPILGAKLRNLGIKESKVNSLLERIPRPAAEAAGPSDESMEYFVSAVDLAIGGRILPPETERKIMELATRLGIERAHARKIIEEKLNERNARRVESEYIDTEDTVGIGSAEYESGESEEFPAASHRSRNRRLILPVAVMVTAFGVLILSVMLFIMSDRGNAPEAEPSPPTIFSNNTPTLAQTEQKPPLSEPFVTSESPGFTGPKTSNSFQGPDREPIDFGPRAESEPPARPEPIQSIRIQLAVKAEGVRKTYTTGVTKRQLGKDPALKEELLADLAVTMRFCYHRAGHFTSGATVFSSESSGLNQQLRMNRSDRVAGLIGQVDLIPMPSPAPLPNVDSFASNVHKSADEILAGIKERVSRYKRKRVNNLSRQNMISINRDLYQLSKMSDPGIFQRLKELTPTNIQQLDAAIARTLNKLSGGIPAPIPRGRPGRSGYSFSRQVSPGRITQQPTITSAGVPAAEPDPNCIKLLAVTAHYAGLTAKQLRGGRGAGGTSGTRYGQPAIRSEIYCSASDVGRKLLDELDTILEQLIVLTTGHPDGQYGEKALAVARRTAERKIACKTALQKAAVSLDAIGQTLELLVRQSDSADELVNDLEELRRQREQSRSGTDNVLNELRESCYYNLRLWDMLVENSNGKAPALPEGGELPANLLNFLSSQESAAGSEQREQRNNEALNDLRIGLNAYVNGHYEAAKDFLGRAQQSQYVKTWADSELLTPLETIRKNCEKALKDMSTCKKCDGSGLVACDSCSGAGSIPCPQCRGYGMILSGGRSYPCSNCQGKGYQPCSKCNGEAFEECDLCTAKAATGFHEKEAIEDVMAKAAYLSNGGIDLFTPGAFEASPGTGP